MIWNAESTCWGAAPTMPAPDRSGSGRVRELCRQLKPVIGAQADRIWMAYAVETEAGKRQIEDYLEILAARYFQGTLDAAGPGLVPPTRESAQGDYALGDVVYNGKALFPFGLRESEWTQHVGVFGRSGAGKTNLGFLIVQQLLQHGKPLLIVDWKRSYRDLLALPGFENMAVYTVGRPVTPFAFNPLIPPSGTNPKTWLSKVVAVVAHAYLLGDGVVYLLQQVIDETFEAAGIYTGSVDRWPTFRDVLQNLKQRQTAGREAGWLSSALRAVSSLCFGEMDVLVNQGEDDIADLLTRPVIMELDALTQSDKVFVTSLLLMWIHHYRMHQPERERFQHCLVLEEAHHLLSDERRSLLGGQSVMEIVFREIREFNESIVYLDQHPSQISMPALGNTYTAITFNVKTRADANAMSQAMMLQDQEKELLGNLQIGEAVVRLQGRESRPFMIRVPEFVIRKGAMDDSDVIRHMHSLGLAHQRRRGSSVPLYPETDAIPLNRPNLDDGSGLLLAFLRDVRAYPDSGVAHRYQRLGISVRQGQKLKAAALAERWITEEMHTTHAGKTRVVGLTMEGQLALERASTFEHGGGQSG